MMKVLRLIFKITAEIEMSPLLSKQSSRYHLIGHSSCKFEQSIQYAAVKAQDELTTVNSIDVLGFASIQQHHSSRDHVL